MRPHRTTIWGCLGWGMPGVVFSFQTGRVFLWRSWLMHLATQGSPRRVQLQWKWLRQVLTEKIKWAHEGPKHTQRTKSRCAKCCKAYTDITWVPLLYTSFMPKEKKPNGSRTNSSVFTYRLHMCCNSNTLPRPNWLTMANQANHSAKQQLQLLNFGEKATVWWFWRHESSPNLALGIPWDHAMVHIHIQAASLSHNMVGSKNRCGSFHGNSYLDRSGSPTFWAWTGHTDRL